MALLFFSDKSRIWLVFFLNYSYIQKEFYLWATVLWSKHLHLNNDAGLLYRKREFISGLPRASEKVIIIIITL